MRYESIYRRISSSACLIVHWKVYDCRKDVEKFNRRRCSYISVNMLNMEQNTQTNLKKNEKYIQDFKRKFCTIKRLWKSHNKVIFSQISWSWNRWVAQRYMPTQIRLTIGVDESQTVEDNVTFYWQTNAHIKTIQHVSHVLYGFIRIKQSSN